MQVFVANLDNLQPDPIPVLTKAEVLKHRIEDALFAIDNPEMEAVLHALFDYIKEKEG